MFENGFDTRIKVSQIIENQIPEFILSENKNFSEFLKQYYISQEYQGAPLDLSNNLDQYLKLDNLVPEVISKTYTLTEDVYELDDEIFVSSTVGFPKSYGLLKIDDEIITYTGITTNTFTGCIRGFSGIDSYEQNNDQKNLVFKKTEISQHSSGANVENLSNLFLKEFYKKIKSYFLPGLENTDFVSDLNVGNFIKQSRSFYESKGTEESFRILFNVLYGVNPKVIDLEKYLIKASSAEHIRRKILVAKLIGSGNPFKLIGQSLISVDKSASGPISEIDSYQKNGEILYKISLFEGYDDDSLIQGTFKITPKTKVIGTTLASANTITVDSTIGFNKIGYLVSGNNIIQYTDKSVNQFFNCTGISDDILDGSEIRSDEYVFSYEDGNLDNVVKFAVMGVLTDIEILNGSNFLNDGEKIIVDGLGDYIINPDEKSYKEFVFNSWIYNTSCRFEIFKSENNTSLISKDLLDKSSIKSKDFVQIIDRSTNNILAYATVESINQNNISLIDFVNVSGNDGLNLKDLQIDVKRILKYASSSSIPLKYENSLANVQNTYNENDEYIYIATNSLPDYEITKNISLESIEIANSTSISNNSINFSKISLSFITGDRIVYFTDSTPIVGLQNQTKYYVKVSGNSIKLYKSLSLIDKNVYLEISPTNVSGRHNFVLEKNYSKVISPSKSLRKFPLNLNFNTGTNQETKEQKATGILINGVEISNYKGSDKIYYGPLGVPTIYNTGNNYDVANPPVLEVESPQISTGTTAHIQPILSGSVTDVLLNQVNVPIKSVSSISISGGNGGGAVLEPVIENKYREVEFNAKTGINFSSESIIFSNFHNFYNGEPVVYSNNGNASLGIGTYLGSNQDQEKTLLNGGVYYAKYVTPYAINLYETVNDFNSGINTVGFTTVNTNGIHKFRSLSYEKVLTDIKVINGGFYENRKLIVKPAEISLSNSSIVFKNHGFSDGELVIYTNTQNENLAPLPISGLTTNNQYYIIKISDDEFRLANAGIGATISNNYIRKNYAKLTSIGSGYHIFNYPEIKVDINVSYANTTGIISAIPVVRGSINDLYVYEKGSDYGSDILNLHKIPSITTKNGKNAVVRPIVTNGKITEVVVDSVGSEYYSLPDLIVSGKGSGAKLKANINDGKLTSITVIKTGIGYASTDTFIEIKPSGTGFKCDLNVRKLTINNQYRFGGEQFSPINDSEVTYQISGYEDFIRNSFSDNYGVENTPNHSPIIGWAFDGNPIYGPFGYSDPDDQLSIKLLLSSYKISQSEVENRPNFPIGMFIEDYVFDNSGDLDEHNGRYTKTPDFPNGVYAYFATIKPNLNITNTYEPSFPYFIGNSFKSKLLPEIDDLTQDFDFINSNLLRNTFPYVIGKKYSSNDYIEFSYNDVTESSSIDGVTYGNISSFEILNSGDNYKVGDSLVFDNSLTSGYGVSAEVSEVVGKNISSIETQITSYNDCIVTKFDENNVEIFVDEIHTFDTGDYVTVTGISSYIKNLDGQHQIKVDTFTSTVLQEIPSNNISGIVTDIYVSNVPSYVSSGSSIGIGTELLSVLNVFGDRKVLRVKRGVCGSAHTQSTEIEFKPNSFKVPIQIDFIDSNLNKKTYFNPKESIGIGSIVGINTSVSYKIGELELERSIQTQSIFIPNHSFKNNERVILGRPSSADSISVLKSRIQNPFQILSTNEEYVYIVNKSKDFIGIKTDLNDYTVSFFGTLPVSPTGLGQWVRGVLAPNGKIYAIPFNNSRILKIDPVGLTTSVFGNDVAQNKYSGGVLAPNGKIYCIPYNRSSILVINPETDTTSTFGSLTGSNSKWSGGVLAPNGKIYAIPYNSPTVLAIDPVGVSTSTFGSLGSSSSKWSDGVLARNGKIYAIPYNSSSVLEIDPETETTSTFGSLGSDSSKWEGGVLAPNGKIYAIPHNSSSVLEIDPVGLTTSTFGDLGADSEKWSGGVLASNGKIYGMPLKSTNILVIDPETKTTSLIPCGISTNTGGVLSPDGNSIYAIPYNTPSILQLDINPATSNGLLFTTNGSDNYEYYIKPIKNQIISEVKKIETTVSVSTSHNLSNGDIISLNVISNQIVGIGTSSKVKLEYNSQFNKILVDSVGFTSLGVNTSTSTITIQNHNFNTGDKVFYNSDDLVASGLSTGEYFVSKIDDNRFNLSEVYYDLQQDPPTIVSIASSGGSLQSLSLINPSIKLIKNNDLIFDLSDSSLDEYNLKFFVDNQFINEFVSTGSSSEFNSVGIGSSVKLSTFGDLNYNLYYTLEKNGELIDPDNEVSNYSQIILQDSVYNKSYSVTGVGTTTFKINLKSEPENLSYNEQNTDSFSYTTKSKTASGGIYKIKSLFNGENYNKLPEFVSVSSTQGKNAQVKLISNSIGQILENKISNRGFSYPSDLTLKPKAQIPQFLYLKNNTEISKIEITSSGNNYFYQPSLVLVNSETREKIDSGSLSPILSNNSIVGVDIISSPKGLSFSQHEIYTLNNTNGIGINSVSYSTAGIVTCVLYTPLSGFSTPPFSEGDKIFVEGIEKISGNGFNSEDYGFRFFTVKTYYNTNPAVIEFDLSEFTSNAGIAKTIQNYASAINYNNYAQFKVYQKNSSFITDESILININNTYTKSDLRVVDSTSNYISLKGRDLLKQNYIIKGLRSGTIAQIESIQKNNGFYKVGSTYNFSKDWSNDTGKLNFDLQVTPDNDYYQNLSYSVQSPVTFEEMIDPVNNLLHTAGLKNFADVGISSIVNASIASTSESTLIVDILSERRVDTINQYDLVKDYDTFNKKSKYIKFNSKKLSDYFLCSTNRVLEIDNIKNQFLSKDTEKSEYLDIISYPKYLNYSRFLVQTVGIETSQYQLDDVIVINDDNDVYTVNRGSVFNGVGENNYANISGNIDEFGNLSLRFNPSNTNNGYKIKSFRNNFNTSTSGIGTKSVGYASLTSKTQICSSGITTTIVGVSTLSCESFISEVVVYDSLNNINFYEVVVDHDGINSYNSQYYFDNSKTFQSSESIGSLETVINDNKLYLTFTNNGETSVTIKSKTINFSNTSSGINTFRFKSPGQPDGSERSVRLQSDYSIVSTASTIISVDSSSVSSFKSLIRIKNNDSSSLHQVLFVKDESSTYTLPKYYLSVGSTTGLGTFGSEISGSNAILKFYPDQSLMGTFEILSYSEIMYSDLDYDNDETTLNYGTIIESIQSDVFNSKFDLLEFDLNYNNTPIFQKTFNPSIETVLNKQTGEFFIENHFFSNNEELFYDPKSTFIGVGASAIGIGTTIAGGIEFDGDIISGFSTITGVNSSDFIEYGQLVFGPNIPANTTVVSVGQTYQYFKGDVVGGGSTVITGIANTIIFSIGSGIFSGDGTSLGTVQSIGISSITSTLTISAGNDRLYYTDRLGIGVSLSNVSVGTTFRESFSCGILTDKCPSTVYAIKLNNNKFKITGTKNSGIGFTFTDSGEGNSHTLTMVKRNEKSLISIDGITQYPILYTPLSYNLNNSISLTDDHFSLSGIASIRPNDLLKIDEEYCRVINVGLGTTTSGPITGIGTFLVANVSRGFVGSSASTHTSGTESKIYRGSYNIVGNKIFFTEAPKGNSKNTGLNNSNLDYPKSEFSGRVFLRKDYSQNIIYDDFSDSFNGIGKTYSIKYLGDDVSNIEPGSGLLFVNEIFQTPSTENNEGNNYELVSIGNTTNVEFTGILNSNYVSDEDINQNELPRGGIIISLGSTSGLGFAPLVGASVTAVVGAGGSIVSVGLGTTDILGSGYRGIVSIGLSETSHAVGMGSTAIIIASVGAGGTLSFTVSYGGTGYTNPKVTIPSPSYENLPITGVSRIGIGTTTKTGIGLSITVDVKESVGVVSAFTSTYRDSTSLDDSFISGLITGSSTRTTKTQIYDHIWNNYSKFDVDGDGIVSSTDALILTRYLQKTYIEDNILNGIFIPITAKRKTGYEVFRHMEKYDIGPYGPEQSEGDGTYDVNGDETTANDSEFLVRFTYNPNNVNINTYGIPVPKLLNTTFFEVESFNIVKSGYSFQKGDVFKPVGLVTDYRLSSPISEFEITVLETFTDSSALLQFGELDYIDSISNLQDGVKNRFPLYRNNQLLSFEIDPLNEDSKLIDFDSLLVIFVNGILQKPKDSYSFSGGTSFIFNTPPKPEDKIDIFFYRGTRGIDSDLENVFETIKIGDNVSLLHNSNYPKTIDQDNRVIFEILTSDLVETNLYSGVGIDDEIFKPIDIIPQKSDKIINSTYVSKSRDSLSSLVFPTSKIIKNVLSSDTEIFVDDASSFNYEENTDPENNSIISFDALLTVSIDPVIASLKANVLNDSSISISILDGGSGYIPSSTVTLDISTPSSGIGVGIGTTAQATALVSVAGTISSINIINSGFGYTSIPQVISPLPSSKIETISEIKFVQGFSGIITGITTTSGTNSNPLALKFFLKKESGNFNTLLTSYPIFISNTQNQNGVISINNDDNDVVGIGTTFLDNIYYVHSINRNGLDAEIVTNIKSDSIISSGFSTSGPNLGRFSWGRLSSFERSNPNNFDVSGNIVSGLSSYPQIQRRGYGLRNTGSFKNQL